MFDPLLFVEYLEVNPDWEVRHLPEDKGVFIGPDHVFYEILEKFELDE